MKIKTDIPHRETRQRRESENGAESVHVVRVVRGWENGLRVLPKLKPPEQFPVPAMFCHQPSTSKPAVVSGFTLGLDLGDRLHHVYILDAAGNIVREAALSNTYPALAQRLAEFPRSTVALEAGTHSPWISRFLTEHGAQVLVANLRKFHAHPLVLRLCRESPREPHSVSNPAVNPLP